MFNKERFYKTLNVLYANTKFDKKTWKYELPATLKGLTINELLTKSNESMSTTQADNGWNFTVPEQLEANVIARVTEEINLLSMIPASNQYLTMPSDSYKIPAVGQSLRMSRMTEQTDVPGAVAPIVKANTKSITLNADKLATTIYVSYELMEDAVINFQNFVEAELTRAFEVSVHNFIINGDNDTANTNINTLGAVPSVTFDFMWNANWLRKLAISAWNTVNSWTLDVQDIRKGRSLLKTKGTRPSDLLLVMNSQVYFQLLSLTQVETIETFGANATIVNGVLTHIDGIQVVVREEVLNADADWKVNDNTALNTKGQILIVHVPSLFVGFKRLLMIEVDTNTSTQQYLTTASTRLASNVNQNDFPAVALIRNITLV